VQIRDELVKTVLNGLYDGVYIMDRDRKILYWNKGAERITGFRADEAIGIRCRDNLLIHVDENGTSLCTEELCPAHQSMQDGKEREAEVYLHHKAGHRLPITTRIWPLRDKKGKVIGAVEVFTDNRNILELTERMEELEKMALLDQLTQIGNRRYADIQLRQALNEMERYDWPFAVFFLDIDRFKHVNDSYGHAIGDMVLQMAAKTLSSTLRSSDVVSRWGGEEFVIIVRNPKGGLRELGNRIRFLIARSGIQTPTGVLSITVSVGATFARKDDTAEGLVLRADRLMYQSKKEGRDRVTADD
jgi:diguanylate cyclase (GGDEF)-like protein/PAS domain S-box-containing protein